MAEPTPVPPSKPIAGYLFPNLSVVIPSGEKESEVIDTSGYVLSGVYIPDAMTGNKLTFLGAPTPDGPWSEVCNNALAPILYNITLSSYYALSPEDFEGLRFIQLQSSSAEGDDRVMKYSMRGVNG